MTSRQPCLTLNESIRARFEALQCMARRIVHDGNNYYGILQGYISLLEANLSGHEMVDKYLPPMKEALQSGIDFNKQLAVFYRESQPMVAEIDLPLVVREVCEHCRRELDLEVEVVTGNGPDRVSVDEPLFRILIENLCKLALHTQTRPARLNVSWIRLAGNDIQTMVFDGSPGMYAEISMQFSLAQHTPDAVINCLNPFAFNDETSNSRDLGLALLYNHLRNHQGNLDISHDGDSLRIALFYPERKD